MKARRVLEKILAGSRNIRFEDACRLATALGFELDRTAAVTIFFCIAACPV